MLDNWGKFSWPWTRKDSYVNTDLDPVVLVPGIGGSVLEAVNDKGQKERIWVRLFAADHEFKSKLWSLFDPETGKTNSLDPKTRIEVPEDRHGLYSCDVLDPSLLVPLDIVCYFHNVINKMLEWGYQEGTTLFGFGYDFRQSNRLPEVLDKFKARLESAFNSSGGKKVNIISHSMGGLLVKSFLALHHDEFEKYVNSWIAIAAPFQGAPGFILDVLLTGCEFVKGWQREFFIAKWSMHQLLIECPSVYELMANPEFEWSRVPLLNVWRRSCNDAGESSAELETYRPDELFPILTEALADNTISYGGATIPLPFNKDIFEWAKKTQKLWQSAKLPPGVKFYNIFGTSYDTPLDVRYGSEKSPIGSLTDILKTEAEFFCVDGDGTVPQASAMADNLDAVARVGIPGDHRGLLSEEHLFRVLKQWLNAGEADPFYDPLLDFVILPTLGDWEAYYSQGSDDKKKAKQVEDSFQTTRYEFVAEVVASDDGAYGTYAAHAEGQMIVSVFTSPSGGKV